MHHVLVASNPLVIAAARSAPRRIGRWIVLLVVIVGACYAAVHLSRSSKHHSPDDDTGADDWPRRPTS
jgi:hypothetical protein